MSYNKLAPILVIAVILVASATVQSVVAQSSPKLVKHSVNEGAYSYSFNLLNNEGYTIVYTVNNPAENVSEGLVIMEFTENLELSKALLFTLPSGSGESYFFMEHYVVSDTSRNHYALGRAYTSSANTDNHDVPTLVKFDSSWGPLWVVQINSVTVGQQVMEQYFPISNPILINGNVVFAGGNLFNPKYLVMVSAENGSVEKAYAIVLPQSEGISYFQTVLEPYDNGFYFITSRCKSGKCSIIVAKVLDDLTIQWANVYEAEASVSAYDAEVVDDKLFITGYESEDSAFIMGIDDQTGEPLFYKVFLGENHYTRMGMNIDYYGGKLYVYGSERNSSEISDLDTFVAVFDLNGNLEDYIVIGRSGSDTPMALIFFCGSVLIDYGLLIENGEYVLASRSSSNSIYIARFPWNFEGRFVWENSEEEEFEVRNCVDEISVTSKNVQAQQLSMSFEQASDIEYSVAFGDGLEHYLQNYTPSNIVVAYGKRSGEPMKMYVEDKMAAIKRVLGEESSAEQAYDKLLKCNMSLNSIMEYLGEHGKSYGSLAEGEGELEDALYGIREAYNDLLGSLIIGEIPPIPLGSETYNRLVELYGPLLEEYPSTSGRLQLLHAIFSST
ncbi:MAG: hypothetical protein B6U76_06865, partial [Desulfurococcales archaeon ex4484_217_2]